MDTDSIIRVFLWDTIVTRCVTLNKQLSDDQIGNEIGQMKLENVVKEGYLISPKINYSHNTLCYS